MIENLQRFLLGCLSFAAFLAVYYFIQEKIDEYEGMKKRVEELEERLEEFEENS